MSVNFWIKLISALSLFALALGSVHLYKSELVRDLRARFLRRKIVPKVKQMIPLIVEQAKDAQNGNDQWLGGNYELMRSRADLEVLYQQAKPLFDQERETIAELLTRLSNLTRQLEQGELDRLSFENTVLIAQRVVQELTEIGL
ncbi:hypothetical protein NBRC116583_29770 [Arenicella sp. 4NH20-0111]|uniref:hypothetical protein n=1 Tax=Arenicella sp. 4NH20-0111 TaxID=3127648 RepID=UPI0031067CE3